MDVTGPQYMSATSLDYGSGIHWHFSEGDSDFACCRLNYDKASRTFAVSNLIDPADGKYLSIGRRDYTADELVKLLPPRELAKAIASSITRGSGPCPSAY